MKMNEALPEFVPELLPAKARGYFYKLHDIRWVLDKNVTVNLSVIHKYLSGKLLEGCLKTLAFYASNLSSSHTKNCLERFQHMLCKMNTSEITDVVLINYRSTLKSETGWYLGVIRGFLRRWNKLGYEGIGKNILCLLDAWTLQGNRKGDAIKRQDPHQGPLTNSELQAFNEGTVRAYEKNLITLYELAIALSISNTGRRPIQLSHLRVLDVLCGKNGKGEPFYILNVPRGKQGEGFRVSFKPFAISQDLWIVLSAQSKNSIAFAEKSLGLELQEIQRQQCPLFLDLNVMGAIKSQQEFQQKLIGDKLHIAAAEMTGILQFIVNVANIKSERTGELLHINARRFRYTIGTRAAREGLGELVIAELLDHKDTQNAGVYIKNIPDHVKSLDIAVGFQLAPFAQAFAGLLVDSEKDAQRGDDPTSRIRIDCGEEVGTCGEYGLCGANVPTPCYTCMHFQPWLAGPHEEVYQGLLDERERLERITGDIQITAILDRSINAVAEVITLCSKRFEELSQQGVITNG